MKRVIRQSTRSEYVLIDLGGGWGCAYSAELNHLSDPHRLDTLLDNRGPWGERYGPWTDRFAVLEDHVLGQAERCLRDQPEAVRAAFRRAGERA